MKEWLTISCLLLSLVMCGQQVIVVAKDGSGQFTSIQEAFHSVPMNNKKPVRILVKNGVYKEKLRLDSTKDHVQLIGEDKFSTIIEWNDYSGKISPNGDTINTYTSETVLILAGQFRAENISFVNSAGYTAGQAVAIHTAGDRLSFMNCRFIGNQDVLFASRAGSRQYFQQCYIEGTTDFIFGAATAWFQQCHIHSKKNSHVTAASTPKEKEFGFIFNDCVFTGDSSLHNVSLGRPWRPFAHTLIMHSYIGQHIKKEGWANWNKTENYKTTRYAEYLNYGPSSATTERLPWVKQLTTTEAGSIDFSTVFKDWNPIKDKSR